MADSPQDLRTCPTRVDGAAVLIAHKVTSATCLERQRGGYHKCFTCAYNHAYVAQHGLPVEPAVADLPVGAHFQFERIGYFCVDPDSTDQRPVFNRSVPLKDTWARIQQKERAS